MRKRPLTRRYAPTSPRKRGEVNQSPCPQAGAETRRGWRRSAFDLSGIATRAALPPDWFLPRL